MAQLEFALWDGVGGYSGRGEVMADVYDEHIRLAKELDEQGWHYYYVIEHQNSPVGRITAPTVYLSAIARETKNIRIGTMMWQLPFYHPMRLAQDVAMLDHLSRGRVDFGTGIGVHEHEFIRWNVDYYKRAEMAEEVLKLVKMAWTQDEVTYKGKYWTFDEALPQPKPFQKPYPPIWAAGHSDESMRFAARNNYNLAKNLDTDEVCARKFELFRQTWKESNHSGSMPKIFLMRQVHVAETDEKAHAQARKYLATREGGAVPVGGGLIEKTRIGWGTHARGMGRDSERAHDKERGETIKKAAESYEYNLEQGLALVGSPETIIKQLQKGHAQMGYTVFCGNFGIGAMPDEMVRESIRLFGKKVVPAFRSQAAKAAE
jgi:alkanesulfonate monooxygenase SsuD/methylene tetrahydromethanopterin reductase-like flavin-dependent oxidoreductase (luciferase family)